jgi:hypothetical protein
MLCSDPLVRAFKGYGYNVVRLPSRRFTPLLLLESDGRRKTQAIGPLERNLPAPPGTETPAVHRDDPAPDLKVKTTRRVSGHIAGSFLRPVLAAMGVDFKASATLATARSVVIALHKVRRDWVALGEVAEYLESGTGQATNHVRAAAGRGALFVVTAVLKSDEFSVGVDQSVAEQVEASVPVGGPVTISVRPQAEQADASEVSFTGRHPLAFAFQAVKLIYSDGQYVDFATANGLSGYALPATASGFTEGMLEIDDDLVEVAEGLPAG